MTDFAPLGFQVDTGPLKQMVDAARQTATELTKVADAADRSAAATSRRLEVAKKALEAEQAAAKAAGEASTAAVTAAEKAVTRAEAAAAAKQREAAASRALADEAVKEAKAIEASAAAKDRMGAASRRASDHIGALGIATGGAAQKIAATTETVQSLVTSMSGSGAGGLVSASQNIVGSLSSMLPRLGAVGAGIGAVVTGVVAMGAAYSGLNVLLAHHQDRLDQINGRLKNTFGGSQTAATSLYAQLTAVSQSTGLGMQPTTDSFLRLARTREDIGATGSEVLQLTELAQKLGRVSGAGQGETAAAMLQLSQALASGRLQGDELRSIMEQMPALAKAIADGLGVSVGQLRNMGSEGQLTSDKVFSAILSQSQKIRAEFASLPETVEQATTRMGDSFDRLFSNLGKRLNSSGTVQWAMNQTNRAVSSIADNLAPVTTNKKADELSRLIEEATRRLAEAKADAAKGSQWWEGMSAQGYKDERVRMGELDLARMRSQLAPLRAEQHRASEDASMAAYAESNLTYDAAAKRAGTLATETLKLAAAQKETATSTKTLEDGIRALESGRTQFSPEETAKKLEQLRSALIAVKAEAEKNIDAFAKFKRETADLGSMLGKYGADVGLGQEVKKLIDEAASAGGGGITVSETDARAEVIARRLVEARVKAEKETEELQRLRDAVAHGVKSREDLAGFNAAQAKAAELGATVAATAGGAEQIEAARKRAVEEFRLQRQRAEAESYLAPQNRLGGDVSRDIEKTKRDIADIQAMTGMSATQRNATRFAASLREELRTIPDGLKEAWASARKAQYDAEQAMSASDFARGYEDKLRLSKEELAVAGLMGQQHEIALGMIHAENDARQRGVELGAADLARIRESVVEQAKVNQALKDQAEAIGRLDGLRSTTKSALSSLVKGDVKGAGQKFMDFALDQSLTNVTNGLLGKSGEAGGGLFGGLFGSLLGTGQRGSSAENPLFVTFGGMGGAGGLFGAANDNSGSGSILGFPIPKPRPGAASGLGAFATSGNYADGVDPRLTDILRKAAVEGGFDAKAISGLREGDPRFHGKGMATDISLFRDGVALPNYQNGGAFRDYESYAQRARMVQMRDYPELSQDFRWGGYFSGEKGQYGAADLMHFDLGGRRVGMGGGSWDRGLNSQQRAYFPDAKSVGIDQIDKSAMEASAKLDSFSNSTSTASSSLKEVTKSVTDVVGDGSKGIASASKQLATSAESTATQTEGAFSTLLGGLGKGIDGLLSGFTGLISKLFGGLGGGAGGSGLGGIGSLLSGLGGMASGFFSGIGNIASSIFSFLFHDGAEDIAAGSSMGRHVAASTFMHAPRYHTGSLLSDERPAILQTGERVLSRLDNARLVAGVEAMTQRGTAANESVAGMTMNITHHNDFRGVDPSMRAFIAAQIAKSSEATKAAAVVEVRDRMQKVPGYSGR